MDISNNGLYSSPHYTNIITFSEACQIYICFALNVNPIKTNKHENHSFVFRECF